MFASISRAVVVALSVSLSASLVACAGADQSEETVGEESAEITSRTASFETFQGLDGQFYFNLLAGNGENVLRSEGYTSERARDAGMDLVVSYGSAVGAYQVLEAKNGEYYFNLKASNGEVIATSETYATKSNATRATRTVRGLVRVLGGEVLAAKKQERFELFVGENKQHYFRLRAGNGEIVLGSEGYSSKAAATKGITSVLANGKSESQYQVTESIAGKYSIRLVAGNGATIAVGESYASKSNATRAVRTIAGLLADGAPIAE
jgi:uncharacterized protein